jgi:hypothetical protein
MTGTLQLTVEEKTRPGSRFVVSTRAVVPSAKRTTAAALAAGALPTFVSRMT